MKKTTIPSKTPNDWLAVLSAASKGVPDVVPPGYQTLAQIAQETGKSVTRARECVKAALKAGVVEAAKFSIDTGDKLYPATHYRIL